MKLAHWVMAGLVLALVASARADWDPGDGHKMHYPQMPGDWDVEYSMHVADDWRCSESGYVEDIHFWVSFEDYDDPAPPEITEIQVCIREDVGGRPGCGCVWGVTLGPSQFFIRHAGTAQQGWHDPLNDTWTPNDHDEYFQINLEYFDDPFEQELNNIYWLDIQVRTPTSGPKAGWKTGTSEFGSPAQKSAVPQSGTWWDMRYEDGGQVDMAFVITPEPATLALVGLGLTGLAASRRRRKTTGRER